MDGFGKDGCRCKKKVNIERPISTALFTLHAMQAGLTLTDLALLDTGFVLDMIAEQLNDSFDWPEKAGQDDFDRFKSM